MKKKRKFKNRRFCMLEGDLIESKAFQELSGKVAVVVLLRFHQKLNRKRKKPSKRHLGRWDYTNNGELIFTYSEAREFGITESGFYKAIRELVEDKGFIDVIEPGNWYKREPTKYAITWRWRQYGTDQYKRKKIKRVLPRGIGFQKGNMGGKPF